MTDRPVAISGDLRTRWHTRATSPTAAVGAVDSVDPGQSGYSIGCLASLTGMSVRNIRAHQTNGLLMPPERQGRNAVYQRTHVHRLMFIKRLQDDGFNLTAIRRILASRTPESESDDELLQPVHLLLQRLPRLRSDLESAGIILVSVDGSTTITQPRAIRAVLELRRMGLSAEESLNLLRRVLAVVEEAASESRALCAQRLRYAAGESGVRAWSGVSDVGKAILLGVLMEAFRAALCRPEADLGPGASVRALASAELLREVEMVRPGA